MDANNRRAERTRHIDQIHQRTDELRISGVLPEQPLPLQFRTAAELVKAVQRILIKPVEELVEEFERLVGLFGEFKDLLLVYLFFLKEVSTDVFQLVANLFELPSSNIEKAGFLVVAVPFIKDSLAVVRQFVDRLVEQR